MKPVAAIFDMDGLLLDSERLSQDAFYTTCHKLGIDVASDFYFQLIGLPETAGDQLIASKIGTHGSMATFKDAWRDACEVLFDKGVPPRPDVVTLLDQLKSDGTPRAVATSTSRFRAIRRLEGAELLDYFEAIVCGDEITHGKPAPDIFLKAAEKLGKDPETCAAFEDSPNGVKAAVAAGMHVVQVPDLVQPDAALLALGHTVATTVLDGAKKIRLVS